MLALPIRASGPLSDGQGGLLISLAFLKPHASHRSGILPKTWPIISSAMEGAVLCMFRVDPPTQFEASTFGGVCGHLPKNVWRDECPKTTKEGTPRFFC